MYSTYEAGSFRIIPFGESHGKAVGVVIDGLVPNLNIDIKALQSFVKSRGAQYFVYKSQRNEPDKIKILSGIYKGKTTGAPICIIVKNKDAKPKDYSCIQNLFRPGHADYTYFKKYGIADVRGGGRASGRETVSRVIAGGIFKQFLDEKGICIKVEVKTMPNNNTLKKLKQEKDSAGGIVSVRISSVPAGLGDPVFFKLDAMLAWAMLSIGAVKGIEFGLGRKLASMKGSSANDEISSKGFLSNKQGGILGGISTGQDIYFELTVKPVPSIAKKQHTIDVYGHDAFIQTFGRHDICACPKIAVVAEAMASMVIFDAYLRNEALQSKGPDLQELRCLITKLDEELATYLVRRLKISEMIGCVKREANLGIRDIKRELQQKKYLKKFIKQIALSEKIKTKNLEKFTDDLWDVIFAYSRRMQKGEFQNYGKKIRE